MQREEVTSTSLRSVGYDEAAQTLEVEFRRGKVYQFANVPPAVRDELLQAESKGRYFQFNIRDKYAYKRLP